MPMIFYDVCCPQCHQACVKRRSSASDPPVYCSDACYRAALSARNHQALWRKYHFDEAMNQAIIRAKRSGLGGLKRLWRTDPRFERAGVSYAILKRQAILLGVLRTQPQSCWQPDETAFALARWEQGHAPDVISRAMRRHGWHRSPTAVVQRMGHAGVRRNGEFLALGQVALAFGVDSHVPARWVARGWLQVHHTSDSGEVRFVSYADLRRFALAYPGEVAKGKVDVVWLIGLLVPPSGGDTRDRDHRALASDGSWLEGAAVADRAAAE